VVQEWNVVSLGHFNHVLLVNNKCKQVDCNYHAGHSHYAKATSNQNVQLIAAIHVQASKVLFLVFNKHIDVVFPNSRNLFFFAS
jgi:hypothetical protein